ncbi:MAG TPA: hypothetical protein VHX36_04325 [Candidatus Acidoferrales bacterium]|jgi:hypothetical protein|nr:hypothetical protein [Candidatus Acidoferrales bacterium]
MFEEQREEDQQSTRRGTIVVISIIVVLAIVGTLVYLDSKGYLKSTATSAASNTPAAAIRNANPVQDLHVVSEPTMVKDDSGAAAWLVDIRNESQSLTYAHIKYTTIYGGANQSVLAQNNGEMSVTLAPGEEQNVQFKDIQYPDNLQWFRVKITGADASQ